MENQVTNAVDTLKFLTSSIRAPTTKPMLRASLQAALERLHDYDPSNITQALDLFFGGGLKVVQ